MQLCLSKRNSVVKCSLKQRFQGGVLLPSHIGERAAIHQKFYGHTNAFCFNHEVVT